MTGIILILSNYCIASLHDKVYCIQDTGYRIQDTSDQDLQNILEVNLYSATLILYVMMAKRSNVKDFRASMSNCERNLTKFFLFVK